MPGPAPLPAAPSSSTAATASVFFTWDALALLVRGYARLAGGTGLPDLERVAEEIRCHYLEHGDLAVRRPRRQLHAGPARRPGPARAPLPQPRRLRLHLLPRGARRLLFGGNLADLVDAVRRHAAAQPRRPAGLLPLPLVPGRETLFDGFYRLLPGEQVSWDGRRPDALQRHTFAGLRGDGPREAGDWVDRLEETMTAVLRDCAAHRPGRPTCCRAAWTARTAGRLEPRPLRRGRACPPATRSASIIRAPGRTPITP